MHNSSKRDLADGNLEISTMTSEQKIALFRSYDVIFAIGAAERSSSKVKKSCEP